jgi:uncharacterized membrane protein YdjX (TVP38/TMEM64 family)
VKGSFAGLVAVVALLAVAIAAASFILPVTTTYLESLLSWGGWRRPWGPVLLGLVYVGGCLLFVPAWVLSVGTGFILGLARGGVTVSIASVLAATAAFLLGRTMARGWIQHQLHGHPKLQALDEAVRQHAFRIVLLARFSPLFPFSLLNYGLGLTKVSLRDFVMASVIGLLPVTAMYVYLGSTLRSLAEIARAPIETRPLQQVLAGIGLVATVAVAVTIARLAHKALRTSMTPAPGGEGPRHVPGPQIERCRRAAN